MGSGDTSYSVKWENHDETLVTVFDKLINNEAFSDCILVASDGTEFPAHKILLASASPMLDLVLRKKRENHPFLMLTDVGSSELSLILRYIYKGTVDVDHQKLKPFLHAARRLQVSSLGSLEEREDVEELEATEPEDDEETTGSEEKKEKDPFKFIVQSSAKSLLKPKSNDTPSELEMSEEDEQIEYLTDEDPVEETGDWMLVDTVKVEGGEDDQMYVLAQDGSVTTGEGDEYVLADDTEATQILMKNNSEQLLGHDEQLEQIMQKAKRTKRGNSELGMKCIDCGSLYKNKATFINHRRHDCKQVHKCNDCEHIFKNKRHLLDHVRDDCGRVHVCPKCKRNFRQKVNLTTHMKNYCKPKPKQSRPRILTPSGKDMLETVILS